MVSMNEQKRESDDKEVYTAAKVTNDWRLLSRILAVVKSHRPQGIDLMNIYSEFYQMFQTNLSANDYNFKSIYHLLKAIETETNGSLLVAEPDDRNLLKTERLFLNESAYSQWLQKFKIDNNVKFLETLTKPLLPEDVVLQHEDRLPFVTLPKEAIKGLTIVAYSGELSSDALSAHRLSFGSGGDPCGDTQ